MTGSFVGIVLALVVAATALNLFLVLRLASRVLPGREAAGLVPLIGKPAPALEGVRTVDGARIAPGEFTGRPAVLVFLSPSCPTCRSKIGELVSLLAGAQRSGVALWIVLPDDFHDVAGLTGNTPLEPRTLALNAKAHAALNPLRAAPLYVFLDDQGVVQAGSYLGDENWRIFADEMRAAGAAEQEPAWVV